MSLVIKSAKGWQRPNDWLEMPYIKDGDQTITLLIAIYEGDTTYIAFNVDSSGTDLLIDWGDGLGFITEPADVTAQHSYEYADHAGTETTEGYRQAIIIIKADLGETLTGQALLTKQHASQNMPTAYSPLLQAITAGSMDQITFYDNKCKASYLKSHTHVGDSSNIRAIDSIYRSCSQLEEQALNTMDLTNVTTSSLMIYYSGLKEFPITDEFALPKLVLASYLLSNCRALGGIVKLYLPKATNLKYLAYASSNHFSSVTDVIINAPMLNTGFRSFGGAVSVRNVQIYSDVRWVDDTTPFSANYELRRCILQNFGSNFTLDSPRMTGLALNELGHSVADLTGETGKTVNLTACLLGTNDGDFDATIWTNKNWTVLTS